MRNLESAWKWSRGWWGSRESSGDGLFFRARPEELLQPVLLRQDGPLVTTLLRHRWRTRRWHRGLREQFERCLRGAKLGAGLRERRWRCRRVRRMARLEAAGGGPVPGLVLALLSAPGRRRGPVDGD